MKISIIGYSGSGKSTLAAALAKRYTLPVLHLDRVQFAPGWVERDSRTKLRMVREFLDENDGWVIDGNYTNLWYEERLAESDLIIFLDFGRWTCLYRVLARFACWHGRTRASMGEGCPEKIDAEFIWWVLYQGRTRRKQQAFSRVVQRWADKVVVLHDQRELAAFYAKHELS